MSNISTTVTSTLHTILSRIEAVFNEVLAFCANIFHVIRGDVVKHVITPAEDVAKVVSADLK